MGRMVLRGRFGFEIFDDSQKLLYRRQPIEGIHSPLQVQGHLFVNHDVPKPRQEGQFADQPWGHLVVGREIPHRLGVVLKTSALAGGEFARDIDHELADREQGEENVIMEGEISLEIVSRGNPRPQTAQMFEMDFEFSQPIDQKSHDQRAARRARRPRSTKGATSAARS